jgi:protein-disulfide isomerase
VGQDGAKRAGEGGGRGFFARVAPWAGATALVVVAVALLYFFTGAAETSSFAAPPVASEDISHGPAEPELTIIEYSDFECPFCAEYATWMTGLRAKYGDRVRFVFRNYPLADHEWALFAAQVAYAAHLQGAFWEMHDLRPLFDSYAESLGLDIDRLHADADAQSTVDFINRQALEGKEAGVSHTPWLVIGGDSVLPRSLEQLERAIEERL